SNAISSISVNTNTLVVGASITGAGIPAGATIATITSASAITISANATATATGITMTSARVTSITSTYAGFADSQIAVATTANVSTQWIQSALVGVNGTTDIVSYITANPSLARTFVHYTSGQATLYFVGESLNAQSIANSTLSGTFSITPIGLTFTGNTTTSMATITNLSINANLLQIGSIIGGAGIPANSTVVSIISATSITISASATATATAITMTSTPVAITGDLVSVSTGTYAIPQSIVIYGDITTGLTTIANLNVNANLLNVGASISGAGIPSGTSIIAINSVSSITLSAQATATTTGVALTYASIVNADTAVVVNSSNYDVTWTAVMTSSYASQPVEVQSVLSGSNTFSAIGSILTLTAPLTIESIPSTITVSSGTVSIMTSGGTLIIDKCAFTDTTSLQISIDSTTTLSNINIYLTNGTTKYNIAGQCTFYAETSTLSGTSTNTASGSVTIGYSSIDVGGITCNMPIATASSPGQTASNWFVWNNNSLCTYLDSALTNSATSMTVGSTIGFSTSGALYIDNEVISYTNITSTTFTGLTRGVNGTTASAHNVNSYITPISINSVATATNISGGNAGEVIYQIASDTTGFTAVGTSGQVLTSAGTGTPTWTTATSANTANAIVQRDGLGNFTAGTITANVTGTASGNQVLITSPTS
ncbi:unnamed protein product, partial [Sphagnum jensenii]